jgi:plasmid stability protein
MSKMIQLRNVTERVHSELQRRASRDGKSLSAYIIDILEREVSRPTLVDWLDSIKARGPIDIGEPAAEAIRAERREAGGDD